MVWEVLLADKKLKIVFINYSQYMGCSGVHIHFLANALVELGHECCVLLPNTDGAAEHFGKCNYAIYSFLEMLELPVEYFKDAILHIWTPRETARIPTAILRERIKLPYLVHMEDNEVVITGKFFDLGSLDEQKEFARDNPLKFKSYVNTHPLHFEPFMRSSAGVTCIIKKLEEFVPPNVPRMTFWPACEDDFYYIPMERNTALRNAFEFSEDTYVLVYPGAIHEYNIQSFTELLQAVEQLNNDGYSVKIVRTGIEFDHYNEDTLSLYKKHVLYVEGLNARELPRLMTLADILVQPGAPGEFDDYRFPSKAPFFLASGRPVILPHTNVAEKLKHGKDCFLMQTGKASEIIKYLKMLMDHPELAKSIGTQGRATARKLFSWTKAAQSIVPFYEQALLKHNNADKS